MDRQISDIRAKDKQTDLQAFMMVCSLMTISLVSALGRETRDAIAVPSVSRMILPDATSQHSIRPSGNRVSNAPIINTFICSQEHHIQSLQHGSLLDLPSEQQAYGVVERCQGEREHGFIAVCEWADDMEVEIG